ncbi:hypothetical protein BDY24DRAFT_389564 [Mrakia frigida]|uniref:uncharacterized protein n=1 Tax=Mrakia frigida TaxID=29902 RepID=UPI003FCC1231
MVADSKFYDLLGVSPDVGDTELKKAYKMKAMQHHPDKNPDDPQAAHEKFQEIQNAYQTLLDPDTRAAYDNYGPDFNERRGGGGGYGPSPEDIFASMFGGGGGGHHHGHGGGGGFRQNRSTGEDTRVAYEVSLEDLYNGKKVMMNLERQGICGHCDGTGGKKHAKPKQCVKCQGKGHITVNRMLSGMMMAQSRAVCPSCEGAGSKIRDVDQCKKCKGVKTVKEKKKTSFTIEKGMQDGERIVLKEHGDQFPGVTTGDVVFILRLVPHPTFTLSGTCDLMTTITLTLSESLTGFSRIVLTHLDGRGISLTVPRGQVVNHGQTLRIENEGMWQPGGEKLGRKGTLWVKCEVEKLSEDWAKSIDLDALEKLLPPKRKNVEPLPTTVDEVSFKPDDHPPKPRQQQNYDHGEYEDEEDDDEYYEGGGGQPECQQQ